jgi:biotin carboxyl carrier protein
MGVTKVGAMRLRVAVALGAAALCAAGCATTQMTSARSVVVSSEPVARQPALSEVASSAPASSAPASSAPASSSPTSAGPVSTVAPTASLSFDAAIEQRLWTLAVSAATAEGSTVKEAEAVGSTHAHAVAVTMGDGVEDDQPVWVVQLEGVAEFVCDQCSVPPGAKAPRGRFQVLIVGASTFRGLDFGLSDTKADLTKLGSVVELHP